MEQVSGHISRNTRVMLMAVIGNVVAVYAFNIGIARMLSPADYGDYKVAESFFNLASIGVLLGGAPAALRFLPGLIQRGDAHGVWVYIRFYLGIVIVASAFLAVATLALAHFLSGFGSASAIHPVIYALAVVPVVAFTLLTGSVLQAAQRMDLAFLPWWIGFPALKLALIAVFFLGVGSISAPAAVMMALLATTFILCFQFYKARQLRLLRMERRQAPAFDSLSWLRVSVPMMLLVALQTAFNQVGIYLIEILGKEHEVGHFAVASTVTLILFAIQLAVMGVFEPLMAGAIKEGETSVRQLNAHCFRRLVAFALPTATLIMLFPAQVLSLFGEGYSDSIGALRLLVPGYLVSTLLAGSYSWLQYSGFERRAALVMLIGVLASITLSYVLIPRFGIEGAAAATTCVFAGMYTVFCAMLRKHLGILPWSRARSSVTQEQASERGFVPRVEQ